MPNTANKSQSANQKDFCTIILVRHGLTPTTGIEIPGRKPGLALSKAGMEEAEAIAEAIYEIEKSSSSIAAIYSSPMLRARQSASYLSSKINKNVRISSYLNEIDCGHFAGTSIKNFVKSPEFGQIQNWPSGFKFEDGESFQEVRTRLVNFAKMCANAHLGKIVVAYSHADPIKILIAEALGLSLDNYHRILINTASASIICWPSSGDLKPSVILVNGYSKLYESLALNRRKDK